jgi:MoaA/NifB/PqqE/SkfB family radical SAM enzyme
MSITERIDAVTGVSGEYAATILPPPRAVKLELTGRCNFTCGFCVTGQRLRRKGDMEWGLLTRLLRETRAGGVPEAGLFYLGESLLHPRLAEAILFAKKTCGFRNVFLTTNGWLATPERVYACARAGLDSLKFSLNAAERGEFTGVTGVDGFDRVVGDIKGTRAAIDRAHPLRAVREQCRGGRAVAGAPAAAAR